jgi:hypothetical protein
MGKEGSHDRRDSSKGTHPALLSAMRILERMMENALRRTFWGAAAAMIAFSGCGAGAQKSVVQTAISSGAERSTAFEATARALDEHPEYVDELYEVARRHPPMLNRFLSDTARDLHDPKLARPTAALLAQHPQSLETTLVDTHERGRRRGQSQAPGEGGSPGFHASVGNPHRRYSEERSEHDEGLDGRHASRDNHPDAEEVLRKLDLVK